MLVYRSHNVCEGVRNGAYFDGQLAMPVSRSPDSLTIL